MIRTWVCSTWIALLCLSAIAIADDEDSRQSNKTVHIEQGKLVGEEHEIEIYDYHSGIFHTVTVYRKPETRKATAPQPPQSDLAPAQPK